YFKGKEKGVVLNKTNAGVISDFYGDDTADWYEQPIILFAVRTEFQGKPVDGLRVRIPTARDNKPAPRREDPISSGPIAPRHAAVFQGTIHSFKTIPSRSVVSITVECPIEQLADIARIAEHGAWVAVARLQNGKEVQVIPAPQAMASPDTGKPKREWRDLQPAAQAGIRCEDPIFQAFLKEEYPDDFGAL